MSCPDWTSLAAHRLAGPDAEPPAGWADALGHFDTCSACRDQALAADPTLVFRGVPEIAADRALIGEVRAGLETLRRVRRVDGEAAGAERRAGNGQWWRRAAAVAILASALAAIGPSAAPPSRELGAPATLTPFEASFGASSLAGFGEDTALDQIDRPNANVYHFDDDRVAVVMVVDAGLDV